MPNRLIIIQDFFVRLLHYHGLTAFGGIITTMFETLVDINTTGRIPCGFNTNIHREKLHRTGCTVLTLRPASSGSIRIEIDEAALNTRVSRRELRRIKL